MTRLDNWLSNRCSNGYAEHCCTSALSRTLLQCTHLLDTYTQDLGGWSRFSFFSFSRVGESRPLRPPHFSAFLFWFRRARPLEELAAEADEGGGGGGGHALGGAGGGGEELGRAAVRVTLQDIRQLMQAMLASSRATAGGVLRRLHAQV